MEPDSEIENRKFTRQELLHYDGYKGAIYIAYKGIVYDVSQSTRWNLGIHEGLHFPGQDLTSEMKEAPHGEAVLKLPHIAIAGRLVERK
jgi:predicted heme/steroid binding protein